MYYIECKILNMNIINTIIIGFGFGVRHALEADHIAAVSTFASRTSSYRKSILTGIFWGLGHTLIFIIVGFFVLILNFRISEQVSRILELCVGIMLVFLGVRTVLTANKKHTHAHEHQIGKHTHSHFHSEEPRSYWSSFFVGSVHGLAGSGSFMLVILSNIQSYLQGFLYIFVFGLGSLGAMALMSFIISIPSVVGSRSHNRLEHYIRISAGILSAFLGLYILYEILIIGGLF